MKKERFPTLRKLVETALYGVGIVLLALVLWLLAGSFGCVSIISKGNVDYDARKSEHQVGTNVLHRDIDLNLRP